ncbi:PREDICTED: glycine-rich RNA-binding protein 3, mitochondrial-like isoform X2 [Tarenaya hassleriana]|nr:PREDICTED: glycine-rich RNA-binding protein 3, mitochondrial-like isoform X2 [Tarenaya hassleriana]XP_010547758.1 PREDICTED: glycine-rich RNA-binding protein 3, mitochondrial-like isoform X2 [Tarenaya hassleriana]
MAFFSKFGNILKQTASKQLNGQSSLPSPSIFQVIRCMSSSKLFVGGISYNTDDQSLREAFSRHGEVLEAKVIVDRETGRSRGFGFVTYTSSEEASSAIQALDGKDLHGRYIRVNYANDRSGGVRSSGFGGNYGPPGGGGYGGGAGGYGASSGSGGYGGGSRGDGYIQGGTGGGYEGGSSQVGGDFGGNNQFDVSGGDFSGNNHFDSSGGLRSEGQFGNNNNNHVNMGDEPVEGRRDG